MLAGATVVLVGLAAVVVNSRTPAPSPESTGGGSGMAKPAPLFDGLAGKVTNISRIVVKKGEQEAILVRDAAGKNWSVENKGGYPAKFDSIRPIVAGLAEASIIEPKTSKPDLYDRLEVEDPSKAGAKSTLITLQDENGNPMASLVLGKRDYGGKAPDPFSAPPEGKPRHFVRRNGEAQSFLAETELEVQADPLSFVDKNAIELKNERVKSAIIVHPAVPAPPPEPSTPPTPESPIPPPAAAPTPAETITVYRNAPETTKYELKELPPGRAPKDEYATSRIAQSLAYVTFDDVKPAAEFDWNSPDAVKGTFECFDGTTIGFTLIGKDGKNWLKLSSTYTDPDPAPTVPDGAAAPSANATADVNAPKPAVTPPAPVPSDKPGDKPADVSSKEKEIADAKIAIKESIKKDSVENNAKWSKWAYSLPDFKAKELRTRLEELLAAPKAEGADAGGAPPGEPLLVPPGPP